MIKIPEQLELRPTLPVIIGNVDYHEFLSRLTLIDHLLRLSGLEDRFVEKRLQERKIRLGKKQAEKGQEGFQKAGHSRS